MIPLHPTGVPMEWMGAAAAMIILGLYYSREK